MEAGGIDTAEKCNPSVKTPHLARIADRHGTYSDTKVRRRTQTDKEFRRSSRIFTRNRYDFLFRFDANADPSPHGAAVWRGVDNHAIRRSLISVQPPRATMAIDCRIGPCDSFS